MATTLAFVSCGGSATRARTPAWLYVSILGAGYFISRGLAKSGSYEPDSDFNPIDLGLDERVGECAPDGR
jgi:hypothetical protein